VVGLASSKAPRALGAAAIAALALLAGAPGAQGARSDQPQVAVDEDGNAYYIWLRSNGATLIAQTRKRNANGTLSAVQDLSAAGGEADSPQLAVDPQGNAYYVWERSSATHTIVQARKRNANGTLSAVQDLSAGGATGAADVAVDAQGNAYFVWSRSNGSEVVIQFRRRAADGTLGSVQRLSALGEDAFNPLVAVDPLGNAYFSWHRFDGANFIAQTRRRAASGALSAVQDLSAAGEGAFFPGLAVDPQGNASFVWSRGGVIQTRRRAASGALGAVQDLAGPGGSPRAPQVAVDPTGAASFVWDAFFDPDEIIQTRRRTAEGLLSDVLDLSAAGADAHEQQLGVDPLGNAYFVWERNAIIQTRRRAPDGTLTAVQNVTG
jgi:hypothetical protein